MAELTRDFATERGNDLALADDFHQMSWSEFDEAVNRAVHALRDLGLVPGDTVAIVAGNCNEWYVLSFACAHA